MDTVLETGNQQSTGSSNKVDTALGISEFQEVYSELKVYSELPYARTCRHGKT